MVGVILDRLRAAHPQATPEQLLLAVRRAEFELTLRVADADGWWEDGDIEDPRWQALGPMRLHAGWLAGVDESIEAAVDDETIIP